MAIGLRPVRYKSGAPYNGAANTYFVPASDATALFIGDPVIIAGDGDANGVSTVTRATAGGANRITGVVVGFVGNTNSLVAPATKSALELGYRPASTAAYVLVADDPSLMFEAEEDADGGALAATAIGNNISLIAGNGSTVTKRSGFMLDSSTAATTSLQLRILGFSQRVNNVIGSDPLVLVSIVQATETPAAGTTGV
jgi:hypothetical protein